MYTICLWKQQCKLVAKQVFLALIVPCMIVLEVSNYAFAEVIKNNVATSDITAETIELIKNSHPRSAIIQKLLDKKILDKEDWAKWFISKPLSCRALLDTAPDKVTLREDVYSAVQVANHMQKECWIISQYAKSEIPKVNYLGDNREILWNLTGTYFSYQLRNFLGDVSEATLDAYPLPSADNFLCNKIACQSGNWIGEHNKSRFGDGRAYYSELWAITDVDNDKIADAMILSSGYVVGYAYRWTYAAIVTRLGENEPLTLLALFPDLSEQKPQ